MKKGDIAVCLNEFAERSGTFKKYGGAGYRSSKIFKIRKIESNILWPDKNISDGTGTCGIYDYAARLANTFEIEAYNKGIYNIKDISQISELFPIY